MHLNATVPGTSSDGAAAPRAGRWIGSERQWLMDRVEGFVRAVQSDPTFRRTLRSRPADALAQHHLDGSSAPVGLTVDHANVDLLINAAQLFGLTSAGHMADPPLELRLVAYGAKPAALVHGAEADLTSMIDWAERRGMAAILGPYEWDHQSDDGKGGYTNVSDFQRRARAGSHAMRSAVIAADEDRAVLAWACLAFNWDDFLGILLGYPTCCVAAFDERWQFACEHHQGDLAAPTLMASGAPPYDWRVNIFGRYFGSEIIQHFPCRLDCDATLMQAARTSRILETFEPGLVADLRNVLCAPAIYTERDGVALLPGGRVSRENGATVIVYDADLAFLTDPAGALARPVWRGSRVLIDADNTATIDGAAIDGHIAWFSQSGDAGDGLLRGQG